MSRISQIIETLEAEKADLQRRLQYVDDQLDSFREHRESHALPPTDVAGAPIDAGRPPKRAKRRQVAKRASSRRKVARSLKRDLAAEISVHLKKHPGATAGELAKALDANRNTVAAKVSQLMKLGDVVKADRGYRLASSDADAADS
jgi:biotin operon repressor